VLKGILVGTIDASLLRKAMQSCSSVDTEVHCGPGKDLERIDDVALIREAAKQIGMAACVLTDSAVIQALGEPSVRAGKVRSGATRAKRRGWANPTWRPSRAPVGLELLSSAPGGELMHLKGYCVDHHLLRTGSANFSRSSETRQDNDVVALRGASVCAGFEAKFDRAWARS
jgi:phosphatidylserine/phosphatidylglycerophosphate/cardiolipin synthase-like enzyme